MLPGFRRRIVRETVPVGEGVLIRAARREETELVRALFLEYAAGLDVDLAFQGFDDELAGLPGNYVALLVAEQEGAVVGCVGVREFEPGVAELKRLYVRRSARGGGLGRALTTHALARAREAGFASIRLDTLPTMAAATELYRRLGFQPLPRPLGATGHFSCDRWYALDLTA